MRIYPSWISETEESVALYDPDELEAVLPPATDYCTVLQNPDEQTHDAAWIAACGQLYPASDEEMLKALRTCIAAKEKVYGGPKVVLMNKSWTTAEILNHPAVQHHLQQSAKPLWEETLKLCDGTETPEWVRSVWMMRLVERAVDYFTISAN